MTQQMKLQGFMHVKPCRFVYRQQRFGETLSYLQSSISKYCCIYILT